MTLEVFLCGCRWLRGLCRQSISILSFGIVHADNIYRNVTSSFGDDARPSEAKVCDLFKEMKSPAPIELGVLNDLLPNFVAPV